MEPAEQSLHERERFFGAAKLVAALTITSRILGLVRDMLIIPLGSPKLADAFWTAFRIPNLFRRLFGEQALAAAFVPVFTEAAEKSGWPRARAVLANTAGLLALVLAALVVLGQLGLWAGHALWPGDWARRRLIELTAVMLPFMFTICLLALGSAALNCRGHFAYPAAAPILLNVGLIVAAGWVAPAISRAEDMQFFVIAAAVVLISVLQLLGVVWLLGRSGLLARPHLRPLLHETRQIAGRALPMLIPMGILQLTALADTLIALIFRASPSHPDFPLRAGVVRCLHAAGRLYQFPLGVLGISVATVIFPLLSRYAARDDVSGLRETTNRALRLCVFLGLPAAVGLILLAEPIMTVIFGWRKTEFDFPRAAAILQVYAVGMVAYFCNHILLRAFFSRKETSAPLRIACVLGGVNLVLVLVGIFTPLRARAFGLATAVTATANTAALTLVLRRRLQRIGFARILASLVRIGIATAIMAGVLWLVCRFTPDWTVGWSRARAAGLLTAIGVMAGTGSYLLAAILLRCRELGELLGALRKQRADLDQET